ncbi:hypothetical protein MMC10_001698 [Thelotrema lepadinum]|nr:hypothetical protein [Thelotrema lepadinum]
MTGILSSIQNLLQSILDIFKGLFNTILSGLEGVFALTGTAVEDVAALAKSLVDLVLGNIVIIGVLIAALVGFSAYQQRQGKAVNGSTMSKKLK